MNQPQKNQLSNIVNTQQSKTQKNMHSMIIRPSSKEKSAIPFKAQKYSDCLNEITRIFAYKRNKEGLSNYFSLRDLVQFIKNMHQITIFQQVHNQIPKTNCIQKDEILMDIIELYRRKAEQTSRKMSKKFDKIFKEQV